MTEQSGASRVNRRPAGAFDIRLIIALLIGVYGLVITIMGLWFTTDGEIARADGLNINLWAGIGMLVAALLFVIWTRLRPLTVSSDVELEQDAHKDENQSAQRGGVEG